MTTVELARLVQQMRQAQKNYFRAAHGTPDKSRWLEESKRLEREVDHAVADALDTQGTLFDGE